MAAARFSEASKFHWEKESDMADVSVQVRVPDGTVKLISVLPSSLVADIRQAVCEKCGFASPESYSLCIPDEQDVFASEAYTTKEARRSGSFSSIFPFRRMNASSGARRSSNKEYCTLSTSEDDDIDGALEDQPRQRTSSTGGWDRKRMDRLGKKWKRQSSNLSQQFGKVLSLDLTVEELGIDASATQQLVLRRSLGTTLDESVSDRELQLEFDETKQQFVSGSCPCSVEQSSTLAALMARAYYGASLGDTASGNLPRGLADKLKDFLPEDKKNKSTVKLAMTKFVETSQMTSVQAKQQFVTKCKGLPTYGASFYVVKAPVPGKSIVVPCVLAISPRFIVTLKGDSKKVIDIWPITSVRGCLSTEELFNLSFKSSDALSLMTAEAKLIEKTLRNFAKLREEEEENRHRSTSSHSSSGNSPGQVEPTPTLASIAEAGKDTNHSYFPITFDDN